MARGPRQELDRGQVRAPNGKPAVFLTQRITHEVDDTVLQVLHEEKMSAFYRK